MKFSEYHCFCCMASPLVMGLKDKNGDEIQQWLVEYNLSPMRLIGLAQRAHILSFLAFRALLNQKSPYLGMPSNASTRFYNFIIKPYAAKYNLSYDLINTCIEKWNKELDILLSQGPLLNFFTLNSDLILDILSGLIPYLECYTIEKWYEDKIVNILGEKSFLHSFLSYYNVLWNGMASIFFEGLECCSVSDQCWSISNNISGDMTSRIFQYRNFLGIDKTEAPTIRINAIPTLLNPLQENNPEEELEIATKILPDFSDQLDFSDSKIKDEAEISTIRAWTRQYKKNKLESIGGYELLEVIASGGMGIIYKAIRPETSEIFALKQLHQSIEGDGDSWKRFVQEASLAISLQHPNIVKFYEFGIDSDRLYLVMEYVEGVSLSQRIQKGNLSIQESLYIVKNILQGLEYAHAQGIIHRDIKPSNVMINTQGKILILDFGLAKKLVSNRVGITQSGQSIGTPQYMSPEQSSGNSDDVDIRTDLYSLGIVFYEMLTGRSPFKGDSPLEILYEVLNRSYIFPHELNSKIPKSLEAICLHAMEFDKDNRYSNATEMLQDIARYENNQKVQALKYVHIQSKLSRWISKNRYLFLSMLLAFFCVVFCILTITFL